LNIHLNIILPSTPGSTKWSLSLRFLHQNLVHASPRPYPRYMPRPSDSSRFYHPHNIGSGVQITKLLIMKFSPLPCYLVPRRHKYSPQHPILKHPQPTFLSCVGDQVSHSYKRTEWDCTDILNKTQIKLRSWTTNGKGNLDFTRKICKKTAKGQAVRPARKLRIFCITDKNFSSKYGPFLCGFKTF
jgi:hypothetical protein